MHSFLGVRWKQSGTLGVPPVLTTCEVKEMTIMRVSGQSQQSGMPTSSCRLHRITWSSSILRSLQSCNNDDGSESGGAVVFWLFMLLDVPGNLTATYAPSTLSTCISLKVKTVLDPLRSSIEQVFPLVLYCKKKKNCFIGYCRAAGAH